MTYRIVYMGTPEFAGPALEALTNAPGITVPLVVTQPDRPAGRGRSLQAPPVKALAQSLGLPVYQAASLRTAEQRQPVVDAAPHLIVVAAFGLILGRTILSLPRCGCVNLHASLLPLYRGASPISAAILNGDIVTGVTLMRMERGLDTGPMLDVIREPIHPDDTTASLTARLAVVAADLILRNLSPIFSGSAIEEPQPPGATLTRPLVKADGWVDWNLPATAIERQVRAMWPWPRAWTTLPDGVLLQIHEGEVVAEPPVSDPGRVARDRDGLVVGCGEGALRIVRGQLPGGKPLRGSQLATANSFTRSPVLGGDKAPPVPGPVIQPVEDTCPDQT